MSPDPSSEIQATKDDFLHLLAGEYLITGFFWVFGTVGSMVLFEDKGDLFLTLAVLMISNCIWEMLTGWYADKFRRHDSMYVGFLACLFGFCLMGLAPHFQEPPDMPSEIIIRNYRLLVWVAGVSIWSLGPALLSGAVEAWLVDRCNFFSEDPPEDVSGIFKRSAAAGTITKSIGAMVCFSIFYFVLLDFKHNDPRMKLVFGMSAGISAGLSAWLAYRSRRLQEEYWDHPKYQSNESIFSSVWKGVQHLRRKAYLWFTVGFVGATSLNYVVSSTVWPYLVEKGKRGGEFRAEAGTYAMVLILAELIGSLLSGKFSKLIDRVERPRLRIPVASLLYLAPILVLFFVKFFVNSQDAILIVLIVAAFSFRIVHASVFGLLNTLGQQAIESDERRAVLISISSAFSSLLMSGSFLLFYLLPSIIATGVRYRIEWFWLGVPLPLIFLLAWGGYRAIPPRTEDS